jgi:hypothetical protein
VLRPAEERLAFRVHGIEVARALDDLAVEVRVLAQEVEVRLWARLERHLDPTGLRSRQVHVRALVGVPVHDRPGDLITVVVPEGRDRRAQPAAEEPLLDPQVERRAALGIQVRVALREEGLPVGLEEARLLDPRAGARPKRRRVLAVLKAHGEGRARHRVRAVGAVSLDASAHRQVGPAAEQHPVLHVGAEVGALRSRQRLGAVAERSGLLLDLCARGQEMPCTWREVRLVAGREPRGLVLEARLVGGVEEGIAARGTVPLRHPRAGIDRVQRELVRARVTDAELMREPGVHAPHRRGGHEVLPLEG